MHWTTTPEPVMRHGLLLHLLSFVCWVTLAGCVTPLSPHPSGGTKAMPAVAKTFHTIGLDQCRPEPPQDGMVKKLDYFLMIFDPSASMTEAYAPSQQCVTCHEVFSDSTHVARHAEAHRAAVATVGEGEGPEGCAACHHDFLYTKFKFAKEISRCFNRTIPALDFTASLRTFGSPVYTATTFGPLPYVSTQFDLALQKVVDADGASPLDQTLRNAGKDWFAAEGRMGVLIISDGKDMGESEVLAAKELAGRYGDRICLYTVQIGNDRTGGEVLKDIANSSGQCGAAVHGDTLLETKNMREFVRRIFLQRAAAASDADADGVVDGKDACPGTKLGTPVDDQGCWKLMAQADLLFEFDRYTLKPEGMAVLDQVVDYLKEYPLLTLAISGHTDNVGTRPYNETLSRQRAEAGKEYLVHKGIARERISLSWHAFAKPAASNDTAEGRARNRRIEFGFRRLMGTNEQGR